MQNMHRGICWLLGALDKNMLDLAGLRLPQAWIDLVTRTDNYPRSCQLMFLVSCIMHLSLALQPILLDKQTTARVNIPSIQWLWLEPRAMDENQCVRVLWLMVELMVELHCWRKRISTIRGLPLFAIVRSSALGNYGHDGQRSWANQWKSIYSVPVITVDLAEPEIWSYLVRPIPQRRLEWPSETRTLIRSQYTNSASNTATQWYQLIYTRQF